MATKYKQNKEKLKNCVNILIEDFNIIELKNLIEILIKEHFNKPLNKWSLTFK